MSLSPGGIETPLKSCAAAGAARGRAAAASVARRRQALTIVFSVVAVRTARHPGRQARPNPRNTQGGCAPGNWRSIAAPISSREIHFRRTDYGHWARLPTVTAPFFEMGKPELPLAVCVT